LPTALNQFIEYILLLSNSFSFIESTLLQIILKQLMFLIWFQYSYHPEFLLA
jgi:hypothetical protein